IDHFAPAVTTTYYIYNVIDGNGCISDQPGQNHTVGVFEMPAAMGSDTTICGLKTTDGSHCIIQSATGTGNWLPHPGISFSDLTNCQSDIYAIDYGFYDLTWSMNNVICDTFINVRFTFVEPPVPEKNYAGEPQHLDFKTATHLQGSLPDHFAGEWSVYKGHAIINDPGDPNSYVYDLSPGNNVFTWTIYGNGCDTKTDTTLVNINHRILMPEGFSPNGDGTNDLLVIRGIGDIFHAKLLVYNRWGGEVYFNEDYMNDWDGKGNNGEYLPDDTYYYILEIDNVQDLKGFLVIKR
ncbi:MAG: gliding motility-associated C-terminal domain-containing protein, partial [Bacteroidota bacterium]